MVLHKLSASDVPPAQAVSNGDDGGDANTHSGSNSASGSDDDDEAYSDWVSDTQKVPCRSLFDGSTFPTVQEVLSYDKTKHGFDLEAVCKSLGAYCIVLRRILLGLNLMPFLPQVWTFMAGRG